MENIDTDHAKILYRHMESVSRKTESEKTGPRTRIRNHRNGKTTVGGADLRCLGSGSAVSRKNILVRFKAIGRV